MALKLKGTWSSGHGLSSRIKGKYDPGAVGFKDKEAVYVHTLAGNLSMDYARLGWDILFRDTGLFNLADDEAYKYGSTFFGELHLNAAASPLANGCEVIISPNPSDIERAIAKNICRNLSALGFKNRGVKYSDDLAVLKQYKTMDSFLVEAGFITNKNDNARLEYKADAVELAIMNGVLEAYGRKTFKTLPRKWSNLKAYLYKITHR